MAYGLDYDLCDCSTVYPCLASRPSSSGVLKRSVYEAEQSYHNPSHTSKQILILQFSALVKLNVFLVPTSIVT